MIHQLPTLSGRGIICASLFFLFVLSSLLPVTTLAQELINDERGIYRAEVVQTGAGTIEPIIGTDTNARIQEITVEILEGSESGRRIDIINEFPSLLNEGDKVFVQHFIDVSEREWFTLFEIERTGKLGVLIALFALVLIAFGGLQGARALLALSGSLLAIIYILVPAILAGYNPIAVSIGVAVIVLFLALFFTHGFNRVSLSAFLGTVLAVGATGFIAWFSIDFLHLTGITSENEVYLNFNTDGTLDFVGLLFGAIIIGALGALDDIAITQAATVRELYGATKNISSREAFTRTMRIGKDHVSALVNTLILAYTGAALPLLLLFLQQSNTSYILNIEVFATEVVRMVVGSIGLVLAVPITTAIAVFLLKKQKAPHEDSIAE